MQKAAIDKAVGEAVRGEQAKAAKERAEFQAQMKKLVEEMLAKQRSSGKYQAAAVRRMPATQVVAELHRIYDGKLQAMMMLQNTGAPGSRSPWVAE